jgi:group I intron endonuclease
MIVPEEIQEKSGVYSITHIPTGRMYVGSTRRYLKVRIQEHVSDSKKYSVSQIHKAIRDFGESSFTVSLLEPCNGESQLQKELEWILKLNTLWPDGFNVQKNPTCAYGFLEWDEVRRMMQSARTLGVPLSPQHKANIGKGNKGKVRSELARMRVSIGNKGKKRSLEERAAMSIRHRGRKQSPEAIEQRVRHFRGKPRSEETKAKLSAKLKGRIIDDAWKAKLSASGKGRKKPPGFADKLRAITLARWAAMKAANITGNHLVPVATLPE